MPNKINGFTITESAAKQINVLGENSDKQDPMLRISISGGGCSGFQYHFDLDDCVKDSDCQFEKNDATVIIDKISLDLLEGSELDFKSDLMGSMFVIENPNASTSCGCGSSFSVEM